MSGYARVEPLARYFMYGINCGCCNQPLSHMYVYRDRLEMWHTDAEVNPNARPCVTAFAPKAMEKGRLKPCPMCGTPHTDLEEKCRSCRNQEELLTRAEVESKG